MTAASFRDAETNRVKLGQVSKEICHEIAFKQAALHPG
jgi:hypothetical protein